MRTHKNADLLDRDPHSRCKFAASTRDGDRGMRNLGRACTSTKELAGESLRILGNPYRPESASGDGVKNLTAQMLVHGAASVQSAAEALDLEPEYAYLATLPM
jgi:hypothetical protein